MDQLDDNVQNLSNALIEAYTSKVNWSKIKLCTQSKNIQRALLNTMQTLQRHAALDPDALEHRTF